MQTWLIHGKWIKISTADTCNQVSIEGVVLSDHIITATKYFIKIRHIKGLIGCVCLFCRRNWRKYILSSEF